MTWTDCWAASISVFVRMTVVQGFKKSDNDICNALGPKLGEKEKNKQGNIISTVVLSIDCREIVAPLWFLFMGYVVPGAPPPPSFLQPWCSQDCFLLLFSLLFYLCGILYPFLKLTPRCHHLGWETLECSAVGPLEPAGNGYVYHGAAPVLFSKRPSPQSPPPLRSSPIVSSKPSAVVFLIQLITNVTLIECGTILTACFPWKVTFVGLPTSNTAIFQLILCFWRSMSHI